MTAQRPAPTRKHGERLDARLAPRRAPVQERAQKTVALLLDTAAVLLEEVGVEGFNTNALAARADVRVRTVYRYFPNKLAVMIALAERLAEQWDGWFDGFRALADPTADWRALWSQYIDAFVGGIRTIPGGLAIRRAMRALPELHAVAKVRLGPFRPRCSAIWAAGAFNIRTGIVVGRAAVSPIAAHFTKCGPASASEPNPVPKITPPRLGGTISARPASARARRAAITACAANVLSHGSSRSSKCSSSGSGEISPPIREGKRDASNPRMGPMAERPANNPSRSAVLPSP